MNKFALKNIATDELKFLITNASSVYGNMTETELKVALESKDKVLIKKIVRQIQPKLEEMQKSNPFKKAFLIFKYMVLANRKAECTIPEEALRSFVRTIMPDMIAFFQSEEGRREYEEWLKEEEAKERLTKV